MVFAPNAAIHMLSGHSVARAVRGHFLVDAVLNALLGSIAFDYSFEHAVGEKQEEATVVDIGENEDLQLALHIYDQVMDKRVSPEDLEEYSELQRLMEKLRHTKTELSSSRTSRFWLQYMNMIDILREFLRVERTGNWLHHLQAVQEMLLYLAAAGHVLYTKSIYTHLQDIIIIIIMNILGA